MPTNITIRQSIDIENSGNTVSLGLHGRTLVDVVIRGDNAADYTVDGREEGGTWMQDVGPQYTGSADYNDTIETGLEELRLRCTTGTATVGDAADVLLSAGGT